MDDLTKVINVLSESALTGDKAIIEVLQKAINLQVSMFDKLNQLERDFDRALTDFKSFALATKNHAVFQDRINDELREQVTTLKNQLNEILRVNGSKVQ
jgi:hypothetical protein